MKKDPKKLLSLTNKVGGGKNKLPKRERPTKINFKVSFGKALAF